jgi:predicted nucleic acid-binding protein
VILLDTNVVSEVMRVAPEPAVLRWLNAIDSSELYLATITIAEIAYGLQILPEGQRRRAISDRFERFVEQGFAHRVLAFDEAAAFIYGEIMAHRKRLGRPLSIPDGQIASIAKAHGMTVATRNTADFEETGIELINPWRTP